MAPSEKRPRGTTPPPDDAPPEHELDVGATDELGLRVSVGTLARVLFRGPEERTMIALERTATLREVEGRSEVVVVAKPFGGGIRIVNPTALRDAIGAFRYDSDRSRREGDFRLQIRPSSWDAVKELCRSHLGEEGQEGILDTSPERELAEEFGDALGRSIEPGQYRLHPAGMLVEDTPRATSSVRAPGRPTVRIYYVFEAWLEDPEIVASILESSRASDGQLGMAALRQAQRGGRGRANAALAFRLDELRSAYLALPKNRRGGDVTVRGHRLAGNVSAVLDGVDAPRYELHHDPRGFRAATDG